MREPYLWRTANISWRTCVVVKQMQSNPTMYYHLKTRACIHNLAHHALDEFDRSIRDLYAAWGHPAFYQECTIMIPRDMTWLKE